MKTTTKLLLRSSLAMALGSVSTLALAQDGAPLDLGTLVLRGEKLSVSAEDAAPSITVIGEEDIENPRTQTISQVVQGQANVIADEDATIPAIRGISSSVNTNQVFGSGVVPRVPILVDNVANPTAQSSGYLGNSAWDVGSVEVARGPQPTSTGRNAFSGAIRVFTNDPIFEREAAVRLGYSGLRDTTNVAFMFNQPLIADQLAIRVAGERRAGDTLVRVNDPNVININPNEQEFESIRTKVLYAPATVDGLELKFTYDYQTSQDHFAPRIQPGNTPSQLFLTNFLGAGGVDITRKERYIFDVSYEFSEDSAIFFRASHADSLLLNPFAGTLGAFRDFGALNFENVEDEVELYYQFANVGPISKGVVGIIHNDASEVLDNNPLGLPNVFLIDVDGESTNTAIYGELEWDLGGIGVEGLTLITGGRYEFDDRTRLVFADGQLQTSRTFNEEIFSPKLGLRYEPNDTLEFGYTYSTAFRPGGVEVDLVSGFLAPVAAPLAVATFTKEEIQNHEIYVKKALLDDRLNLSASYFYYIYDDAQVPGASPTASAFAFTGFALTGNIPEAIGQGIELTADYQGDNGLGVNASVGWLDTEITNAGPIAAAFQGSDLPNAPEYTASLGIMYDHPTAGWDVGANLRFVDSMKSSLTDPKMKSYTVLDIGAGYDFDLGNTTDLRLDVSINNVTDEAFIVENTGGFNIVGRPREVLVNLTARF
ncbi:MAG: TonB-dependent receptor [Pseudomonadota bacterium]